MTIRDDKLFKKLLIPLKGVTFGQGYFQFNNSFKTYLDKKIENPERYRIKILPNEIEIYSASQAGQFYAEQTLKDMAAVYGSKLPCCTIEDWPDFKRRGVYLDCSRGKVPKLSTLKDLAVRLAHWKINELQLYIENVFTFKKHPGIGKGYSPFTPDEILELQRHCKKYHIRLVGSLASFGHFERILALPKYQHLGELTGYRGFSGGTTLCPVDPGSIKLVKELYSELVPLFEAEDFNACCDETWELGEGRSKSLAEKIGKGKVYLEFLLKIYDLCQKYGKRMNIWADILLKHPELLNKLPKDIVLLNWEYEQNGKNIYRTKELAKAKRPFMVCPGTSGWLTHGSRLPNSMGNVTNFAEQGRKLGAEGLLNTDWGDNGHRNFLGVSLHSFAHGAAQSWNGKAVDNDKFTENFCHSFFHQSKIADTIKILGNNYLTCGTNVPNRSWLYFALVEPARNIGPDSYINSMHKKGLKKIVEQYNRFLDCVSINRDSARNDSELENFETTSYEELKLAGQMDYLAAKRALTLKNKKYSELNKVNKQIQEMANEFKRLWLVRNKISRLNDNLKLFRKI